MTDAALAGLRALVADDNPINSQIIDTFLKRLGLEPHPVEDGRQAVDAWAPGRFDILCFDIVMQELDGIGALGQSQTRARGMVVPMTQALTITLRNLSAGPIWRALFRGPREGHARATRQSV